MVIDLCETKVSAYQYHKTYRGRKCKNDRRHVFLFKVYRWSGYGFRLDRRLKYYYKLLQEGKNSELRF